MGGAKRRPARVAQEKSCRSSCMCRWKAPWPPGSRRPSRGAGGAESSAGPSRSQWVSSPAGGRAGDIGVSPGRRGRERRRRTRIKAYAPEPAGTVRSAPRATRPSLGPGTRAPSCHAPRLLTQAGVLLETALERVRSPRKGLSRDTARARFAVGQTGRNSGGTVVGNGSPGCCASRRVSGWFEGFGPRASGPMHQNRDGGCGLLPRTRGHVEPEPSARTSWQLQKSSGVVGSRISSRVGLRKEDRRE